MRAGVRSLAARGMRVSLREGGLVWEDEQRGDLLRVDGRGRWVALGQAGRLWRRSPTGQAWERGAGTWRLLANSEQVEQQARQLARHALKRLVRCGLGADDAVALRTALERVERWTPVRFARERGWASRAWPEFQPILPPHRLRDLVVHSAQGCPHARCPFCAFYRNRPFLVASAAALRARMERIRRLRGPGPTRPSGVFLGSASAASATDEALLDALQAVREVFGPFARGCASFLDPDHAPRRGRSAWRALVRGGLMDVTLGLESGEPAVRAKLGKSGCLDRLCQTVEHLKDAGARVSLTVLTGLGEPALERAHQQGSAALLARLPLRAEDRVYLSPLVVGGVAAVPTLSTAQRDLAAATRARVSPYRIEHFAWLA